MHDLPSPAILRGGRKVGRKPAFTAAEAVAAAFAEGIDRFTLAAVAERLGVVTTALYRLFGSREDLVLACLDAVGASIAVPEPDWHWQRTLRLWADECWRVCEEYPGLSRLVFAFPVAPTRIDRVFNAYADNLAGQGLTRRQVMFALDFLGDTVFASHLVLSDAVGDAETFYQPEESWTGRSMMDAKVEFILTGLERNWPEF